MLQLRDEADSILPVSRIDIIHKAIRTEGYGADREITYFLFIYLRGRRDEIRLVYGQGEAALDNRAMDLAAITAEGQNQGL